MSYWLVESSLNPPVCQDKWKMYKATTSWIDKKSCDCMSHFNVKLHSFILRDVDDQIGETGPVLYQLLKVTELYFKSKYYL